VGRDRRHRSRLPLVDAFVVGVDIEAGIVTVDPPDGLPETAVARDRG
jgi:ribosomal 30S subunit maturation factor RimM